MTSAVDEIGAGSVSVTGCDTLGASTTGSNTSGTPSVTITTNSDNSWNFDSTYHSGNHNPTGTNQTARWESSRGRVTEGSSQTTTSAGAYTLSWSGGSGGTWTSVVAEMTESVAVAAEDETPFGRWLLFFFLSVLPRKIEYV
jgi:hypothetical protein